MEEQLDKESTHEDMHSVPIKQMASQVHRTTNPGVGDNLISAGIIS